MRLHSLNTTTCAEVCGFGTVLEGFGDDWEQFPNKVSFGNQGKGSLTECSVFGHGKQSNS